MEAILETIANLFDALMSTIMPNIQPLIPTEVTEALSDFLTQIAPIWNYIFSELENIFSFLK